MAHDCCKRRAEARRCSFWAWCIRGAQAWGCTRMRTMKGQKVRPVLGFPCAKNMVQLGVKTTRQAPFHPGPVARAWKPRGWPMDSVMRNPQATGPCRAFHRLPTPSGFAWEPLRASHNRTFRRGGSEELEAMTCGFSSPEERRTAAAACGHGANPKRPTPTRA